VADFEGLLQRAADEIHHDEQINIGFGSRLAVSMRAKEDDLLWLKPLGNLFANLLNIGVSSCGTAKIFFLHAEFLQVVTHGWRQFGDVALRCCHSAFLP
jgi:hypothetical protein